MNPLVGLQTGWVPQGLMGNVLQQPTQQGLMSVPSLQGVQPGDWSSVAYNMAGRPIQGPSPTAPALPMPAGVSANGSTGSSGGSSLGGTALGILGALAKNPALLKSAGSGVSSLWNSLTGGGAAASGASGAGASGALGSGATAYGTDAGVTAGVSPLIADDVAATTGITGAGLAPVGVDAVSELPSVSAAVNAGAAGSAAGAGLGAGAAAGSGAIGAAGANALAASGGFATGGAAGAAGGGSAAGAGAAGASLAGVAGVAALPALVYGLMSIYDKPGLAAHLADNYTASGQVTQHIDPQLAAQGRAALAKAQAGGGMGGIAGVSALANKNTSGLYYTTSSGKRLDAGFTPWKAAELYNAAYVDPKLTSQANVNAYLTYMQQHGG